MPQNEASQITDDELRKDIVECGDFLVDIDKVSKKDLISMRRFFPPEEYRLLKNRKSARICRRKRKEERHAEKTELEQAQ